MKLAPALALAACSVPSVDYTGKQCPCPSGYACDPVTQTCTRAAIGSDADVAIDSPLGDAPPQASCLAALDTPFTHLEYETPNFSDFATNWKTDGGTWMLPGNELDQVDAASQLAVAYHPSVAMGSTQNYRISVQMHATSTGDGQAIELTLRVDAANTHMYHCNWEPSDGAFLIQRTDSVTMGSTVAQTTIDLNAIANYKPSDPVWMEFQVQGSTFSCCMHDLAGAVVQGEDSTYTMGAVGLKTYEMSGAFHDFQLFSP